MFNLFDEDGNGNISVEELLNMMAFFIEIGMDTGNVDMAKTMAEVFQRGDANKDDKLNQKEFVNVSKSKSLSSRYTKLQHTIVYFLPGHDEPPCHCQDYVCEDHWWAAGDFLRIRITLSLCKLDLWPM